jgi:hypothetical protein
LQTPCIAGISRISGGGGVPDSGRVGHHGGRVKAQRSQDRPGRVPAGPP